MSKLASLKKAIKNPYKIAAFLGGNGMLKFVPDRMYLKMLYRARFGEKLDMDNPKSFNQKIQWLKLYDRNPTYTDIVDKYEVRKYMADKIGEEYLIPILGVWDSFDEIDFDKLPDQFVLKCTHDSGGLVICKDKSKLDINAAKKSINKSLKQNFYYIGREMPYKNIKPRIICEKYMADEAEDELKDYKFMCFNGEVKCSFVCLNRNSACGLNVDFYDLDWQPMPFERHYKSSGTIIPKPHNYQKMIELSELLAKEFSFVRVDLYEVNGRIYFGELTFYPGSGLEEFEPESYDYLLGSWIELPADKKE